MTLGGGRESESCSGKCDSSFCSVSSCKELMKVARSDNRVATQSPNQCPLGHCVHNTNTRLLFLSRLVPTLSKDPCQYDSRAGRRAGKKADFVNQQSARIRNEMEPTRSVMIKHRSSRTFHSHSLSE